MIKRQIGDITVIHGDAMEVLPTLEKADLICTDPPYRLTSGGVAGNHSMLGGKFREHSKKVKHNRVSGKLSGDYKNDGNIVPCEITWRDFMKPLFEAGKDQSKFFIMCNDKNLLDCLNSAKDAGLRFHNVLVWLKNNAMVNGWGMKNCEYIPFFYKGGAKRLYDCSLKTVLMHDNPMDKAHPTVKPIPLMEELIKASTKAGDLVIDPFGGSGSTALACLKLGRRCIIIEKDEEYYNLTCERLTAITDVNNCGVNGDLFTGNFKTKGESK